MWYHPLVEMSFSRRYLKRQFDATLKMVRQAIDNMPDSHWHWSTKGWTYSLTLYHIIETMEFYLASSPSDMTWGAKAGYDPEKVTNTDEIVPLISKELVLKYLIEIQHFLDAIYETMTAEKMDEKDGFDWFGSIFEKHLYLLRHNQHHLGELAIITRQFGSSPLKWT